MTTIVLSALLFLFWQKTKKREKVSSVNELEDMPVTEVSLPSPITAQSLSVSKSLSKVPLIAQPTFNTEPIVKPVSELASVSLKTSPLVLDRPIEVRLGESSIEPLKSYIKPAPIKIGGCGCDALGNCKCEDHLT
ncbi:hypothetical protein [Aegicerativicinus sediminis]|uniref:hypothetical protein n=1 Tax=Aegicerativicinus sediminis TaxID=2893202 RepID=UPI001E456EED|nr:hypothetical protein [Aegicerativicinus sediminis]